MVAGRTRRSDMHFGRIAGVIAVSAVLCGCGGADEPLGGPYGGTGTKTPPALGNTTNQSGSSGSSSSSSGSSSSSSGSGSSGSSTGSSSSSGGSQSNSTRSRSPRG